MSHETKLILCGIAMAMGILLAMTGQFCEWWERFQEWREDRK